MRNAIFSILQLLTELMNDCINKFYYISITIIFTFGSHLALEFCGAAPKEN